MKYIEFDQGAYVLMHIVSLFWHCEATSDVILECVIMQVYLFHQSSCSEVVLMEGSRN